MSLPNRASTPVKVPASAANYTPATLDPDLRSQINTLLIKDGHINRIQDQLLHALNAHEANWPTAVQSHALDLLRAGEATNFSSLLRRVMEDVRQESLLAGLNEPSRAGGGAKGGASAAATNGTVSVANGTNGAASNSNSPAPPGGDSGSVTLGLGSGGDTFSTSSFVGTQDSTLSAGAETDPLELLASAPDGPAPPSQPQADADADGDGESDSGTDNTASLVNGAAGRANKNGNNKAGGGPKRSAATAAARRAKRGGGGGGTSTPLALPFAVVQEALHATRQSLEMVCDVVDEAGNTVTAAMSGGGAGGGRAGGVGGVGTAGMGRGLGLGLV